MLSNLEELTVKDAFTLEGADLVSAFAYRQLDKLHILKLKNCRYLTDAELMAIAKGCPNIKTLHLEGSRGLFGVTDTSLNFVVNSCKFLTTLNLFDVSRCFFIYAITFYSTSVKCM